jgi:phosphatidate cytidylyltransferase
MGLFLSAFILTVIIIGDYVFALVIAAGAGAGMWEYFQLLRKKKANPLTVLGIIFGLGFIGLAWYSTRHGDFVQANASFGAVITFFVLFVLIIQFMQLLNRRERYSILDLSITVFGAIYIGGFGSMLILLMGIGEKLFLPDNPALSRLIILLPMWAAWGSDVGAYFAGSFWGKTKLFPDISPNKTLEGCAGGVVFSSMLFITSAVFLKIPIMHALLLAPIASICGQIGDFSESAFKRELGVKDSGTMFGSHGGFLDRIDSLLFSTPVVYFYFIWFYPGL